MAMNAVLVADLPNLGQIAESSSAFQTAVGCDGNREIARGVSQSSKFLVIGHRGRGMNALSSPDRRLKIVKENTVLSFNEAGRFPVDFVEFDVQVTKDGCPIIFHDIFILSEEGGIMAERRVTELSLEEFLSYGPQKDSNKAGKLLHRKTKDGQLFNWKVENDDHLCTLEDAFTRVNSRLGFNIELKFDDHRSYSDDELLQALQATLQVVFESAKGRPIIFSTFHPDAAHLARNLQNRYPVFFLTNGGNETYGDERRNSLEQAIEHCLAGRLHGIVSEVRGVFRHPSLIPRIKESNLSLLTYGQLNNVAEAVYMQHLMGIDGVIVDLVEEITEAVSDLGGDAAAETALRPKFSHRELSFLLKLIPELVHKP